MPVTKLLRPVKRYFIKGTFNPASSKQILSVLNKDGGGFTSSDKKVLEGLAKKNPLFQDILNYRKLSKVRGTYCDGVEKRLDGNDRLHCSFMHLPSTMRLSAVNPNLTNVVADKEESPAAGFRSCIVSKDQG